MSLDEWGRLEGKVGRGRCIDLMVIERIKR